MNNTIANRGPQLVVHWYKIPAAALERARKNGFSAVPTEIAIKPQTGQDLEDAAAVSGKGKEGAVGLRLIKNAICGVNYDPVAALAGRKQCFHGSPDPDCIPSNIFDALPAAIVNYLSKAYNDINAGEDTEQDDFLKSHAAVAS